MLVFSRAVDAKGPHRFVGPYGLARHDRHLLSESRFSFPIDHGLRRGLAESRFLSGFRGGSVAVLLPKRQGRPEVRREVPRWGYRPREFSSFAPRDWSWPRPP